MEFKELVESFATRHNIPGLAVEDDGMSLDIDGIVVMAVAVGDEVTIAAEIGEPPVEGKAEFTDALLEANMESVSFFAKSMQTGKYMLMRRANMMSLDSETFDKAIETTVNTAEVWRKMLSDFRPIAKEAAKNAEAPTPSFGIMV